ncbi:MAG: DNA replication and repair protein RecF [Synergistaceae bacterium]|nr:DNA replication and repair protein RecF [Synergistaceae bacterium]
MRCDELRLHNYKNIRTGEIFWGEGLNLLVGGNGAGKTNCLEALHILMGWGPIGDRRNIASWDRPTERVYITGCFSGEEEAFLAAGIGASTVVKYNGKRCSFSDVRSISPSLAFLPQDMALIDGSPSRRRSFVDRLCALLWPLYALRLTDFKRAVRHRIALLKRGAPLGALSKSMAAPASWLWRAREQAILCLVEELSHLEDLLPMPLDLTLKRGGAGRESDPAADWWRSLEAAGPRERACCTPLVGPHRDDILFQCDGMSAANCLSRGQKRRSSVALVIAAGRCIQRKLRRSPILLLDEMASELDRTGRGLFVDALAATGWQVIATAAEEVLPDWPGRTLMVEKGEVTLVS